jgi:hypothetical protein
MISCGRKSARDSDVARPIFGVSERRRVPLFATQNGTKIRSRGDGASARNVLGDKRLGESVGTDSRVLRLAEAVDAPVKPSGA